MTGSELEVNGVTIMNALDRVIRQAEMTPDAPAVVCGERTVSYSDLLRRAADIAAGLSAAGATKGTPVGVALERSTDIVAAVLGIFVIGGVYLPLDSSLPSPRLSAILEDARPACVIGNARMEVWKGRIVRLDDLPSSGQTGELSWCVVDSDDDAYIMYTSGSTGIPKGVVISQGALAVFLESVLGTIEFDPGARHLAITRTTFDISLLELLIPLCRGGRTVIATHQDVDTPRNLHAQIRRHEITSIQATPGYLRAALAQCPDLVTGLAVLVGGEALPRDLAGVLLKNSKNVWNMYGPTEATIWASAHRVTTADISPDSPTIVTIGKPLPKYEMFLLDESRRPVRPGSVGEIFIAGPALAKGYLNQPELTDRSFIRDLEHSGRRMYRTGDLARLHENGDLVFLGRSDRQVKIHGIRLELGDVEIALRGLSSVREAAVTTTLTHNQDSQLTAYVVTGGSPGIDGTALRRELAASVPQHMIPPAIQIVNSIPLTPHGKIDFKALLERDVSIEDRSCDPKDDLEQRVCALYGEILNLRTVRVGDNFFDLGGDSLSGMRLIHRLEAEFHCALTLRFLFGTETVANVVDAIRGASHSD